MEAVAALKTSVFKLSLSPSPFTQIPVSKYGQEGINFLG